MSEAALAVAIAAIAIAMFGVVLQWLAYRATIDQAQKAAQNVAEMRTETHGLVGELRGMTERMVEAQERQFNRMLDAYVTRPAAAAEVAERTGESADGLQQISEAMEALKEEIRHAASADQVQRKVDELAGRLEAVSASATQAARLAEAAAGPAVPLPRGRFRPAEAGDILIVPAAVPRGGRVTIEGVLRPSWRGAEAAMCVVQSPWGSSSSQAWTADPSAESTRPRFVFPDDFRYASTDEPGPYRVSIDVRAGVRQAALGQALFEVIEPDTSETGGQPP